MLKIPKRVNVPLPRLELASCDFARLDERDAVAVLDAPGLGRDLVVHVVDAVLEVVADVAARSQQV